MEKDSGLWAEAVRFLAYLTTVVGVNKWLNIDLVRRVMVVEKENEKHPKREVERCRQLMDTCPVNIHLENLGSRMQRMEDAEEAHRAELLRILETLQKEVKDLTKIAIQNHGGK